MSPEALLTRARSIELLICDVDGVLTDGMVYWHHGATPALAFNVHDGLGLMMLLKTPLKVAIITASRSPIITERMAFLGIEDVYTGCYNKQASFHELQNRYQLTPGQIAYVGDDLPDRPMIEAAGLGIAVGNAQQAIRDCADWVTKAPGGRGAVREVCDLLLQARGLQQHAFEQLIAS